MDGFSTKHCALYSHTQFNFQLFSTDSLGKEGNMDRLGKEGPMDRLYQDGGLDSLEKQAGVDRLGKEASMGGFSTKRCAIYSHY